MTTYNPDRTPVIDFPKAEFRAFIKSFTPERLATFIDVTHLKDETPMQKMQEMAELSIKYNCASVCVYSFEALEVMPLLLKGSKVKNCYVIDFPLGMKDMDVKAAEASKVVIRNRELRGEGKGFIELDMVIHVERFKADPHYTLQEINSVCDAADGELVKVIVRTSELTEREIWKVSEIVERSKAQFIKTSTGMDAYGALPYHAWIMRQVMGNDRGVKAAGGISDAMTAMKLMWAGAKDAALQLTNKFRIGSSRPENIIASMQLLLNDTNTAIENTGIPCLSCPVYHTALHNVEMADETHSQCEICKYKDFRQK